MSYDSGKAFGFLRLLGLINQEVDSKVLKAAYRKAAAKYHPDKGGSVEMMQAINEAYEYLSSINYEGSMSSDKISEDDNHPDELNKAINVALSLTGVEIEICGAWLWVSGNTKPHKETLKEHGFFWAKKKCAWYFRTPEQRSGSRGSTTLDDIRIRYGSQKPTGSSRSLLN